jgi:putative transposon-encoded protein
MTQKLDNKKEHKTLTISEEIIDDKKEISLGAITGGKIQFKNIEEILMRDIKKFGDGSAHIIVPKKHIGKEAQVTIWKQDKKEETHMIEVVEETEPKEETHMIEVVEETEPKEETHMITEITEGDKRK